MVIKGCRQCGKTSSVRQFASKHYKHVVYMDFHEQKDLKSLFQGALSVDYLIVAISAALPDARFVPGKTVISLTRYKIALRRALLSNSLS